ncbi:MAG: rod-binding protein [Azospirillaceae bacterium]
MTDPAANALAALSGATSGPGASAGAGRVGPAAATQAREAAEEFEAVFLSQMLQPMFAGISTDGPFGGGPGEEAFRSQLVQEYGQVMSQAGGVGLTDALYREIISLQEV